MNKKETKPTLGPWSILETKLSPDICIVEMGEAGHEMLAINCFSKDVNLATAKLIAAAPELFEALRRCMSDSSMIDSDSSRNNLKMAIKAIDKATI